MHLLPHAAGHVLAVAVLLAACDGPRSPPAPPLDTRTPAQKAISSDATPATCEASKAELLAGFKERMAAKEYVRARDLVYWCGNKTTDADFQEATRVANLAQAEVVLSNTGKADKAARLSALEDVVRFDPKQEVKYRAELAELRAWDKRRAAAEAKKEAAAPKVRNATFSPTSAQLRYVCKQFIERGLADTSGSALNWTDGSTRHLGGDRYEIVFPGKARNAYGGLVWARFRCVVEQTGKDDFVAVSREVLPQ